MLMLEGIGRKQFRAWAKGRVEQLNAIFDYRPRPGMPGIYELIVPAVHPTQPLILFNYSKTAHSRLHLYPNGWTDPIRYCRGIVFDHVGNLVALPWPKFFNFDGDIKHVPAGPFSALMKYDGHLGIIFEYRGRIFITTRGDFESSTSIMATAMMERYSEKFSWNASLIRLIRGNTLLVEIIHPSTKVYLEYPEETFVLLGVRSLYTFEDRSEEVVKHFSTCLGIPGAERWQGSSIKDLVRLIRNPETPGEGFVACFANGERLKFKCTAYVRRMIRDSMGKNPYAYLIRRFMDGDLKAKLPLFDEETTAFARKFSRLVKAAVRPRKNRNEQRQRLYALAPDEFRTDAYKRACQELVRSRV